MSSLFYPLFSLLVSVFLAALLLGCEPPQVPPPSPVPEAEDVRVAYATDNTLWVARTDGTDTLKITDSLQPTSCANFYLSPDGVWVAYQSGEEGLYVANTGNAEKRLMVEGVVGTVSWFPDSKGIVYTQGDEVYAVLLDKSSPPQVLASGGRKFLSPAWSPDGNYIAFLETVPGQDVLNVILIKSDGTSWHKLGSTARDEEGLVCPDVVSWSPDSTRFLVDYGEPAFMFYVSGGTPVQLGSGTSHSGHIWSPDGKTLAYRNESNQLWVVNADGSDDHVLIHAEVGDMAWSPLVETSTIAYSVHRDEGWRIETTETDDNSLTPLTTHVETPQEEVQWTPDGLQIIYEQNGGIWRVTPYDAAILMVAEKGVTPRAFAIR